MRRLQADRPDARDDEFVHCPFHSNPPRWLKQAGLPAGRMHEGDMLKVVLPLIVLTAVAGCAPAQAPALGVSSEPAAGRRCFSSDRAFSISRPGTAPVYVRVTTGQTLEVMTDDACVDGGPNPQVRVRPLGPENANLCVGDSVSLEVVSASVIARTCRADITRVVPEDEVAGLANRVRP